MFSCFPSCMYVHLAGAWCPQSDKGFSSPRLELQCQAAMKVLGLKPLSSAGEGAPDHHPSLHPTISSKLQAGLCADPLVKPLASHCYNSTEW